MSMEGPHCDCLSPLRMEWMPPCEIHGLKGMLLNQAKAGWRPLGAARSQLIEAATNLQPEEDR